MGESLYKDGGAGGEVAPSKDQAWYDLVGIVSNQSPVGFWPGHEGTISRLIAERQMEAELEQAGVAKLSPDEANKKYPGNNFQFPIHDRIAYIQNDNMQLTRARENWVASAPDQPNHFTAGLMGGLDPAYLALGIGTGRLMGALSQSVGEGALFKATEKGLQPTLMGTYASNLATGLVLEVPNHFIKQEMQEPSSMMDVLTGAATSAAGMTAVHLALGAVAGQMRNSWEKISPDIKAQGIKEAIHQAENNQPINPAASVAATEMRLRGATPESAPQSQHEFRDVPPNEKAFYQPVDAEGNPKDLVDDPMKANHEGETVRTVEVSKDAKLLNMDMASTDPVAKEFLSKVEAGLGIKLNLPDSATLGDVVKEISNASAGGGIPPEHANIPKQTAKDMGFDGFKYTNTVDGQPSHDTIVPFDEKSYKVTGEAYSDQTIKPNFSDGQVATQDIPEQPNKFIEPDAVKEFETLKQTPEPKQTERMALLDEREKIAMKSLETSDVKDVVQEHLDKIEQEFADEESAKKVFQDFLDCYLKDIT